MGNKHLNDTEVSRLYYEDKLSAVKIAALLGVSDNTIQRRLRKLANLGPGQQLHRSLYDEQEVLNLYTDSKLPCKEIARRFHLSPKTVARVIYKHTGKPPRSLSNIGERNPNWKGGSSHTVQGYVLRWIATGQYQYEHILIWEETHQRPLPKGWVVHHINGIKTDNRPSNLIAMSRGAHTVLVQKIQERLRRLEIENRQLRKALEDSQAIFYISEN